MSEMSNYLVDDIEKFLQINRDSENEEQSASLRKLLSVQDKISIFKNINPDELKAILYNLKFVKFKFKDYVVEQKDISEEIFFIIDGECQVFHNKKKVGKLRAGDIFGEAGAIFKSQRNASVVCASEQATLLSFCIDENNVEFCAPALAILYKNLASEINTKLEEINLEFVKK
ncbi:MAG: signal-transduction protein with cAMP-binding, CBS, and nucleotidyltransferase domain [Sulfurimonas sp.]|jgi:signal-transduction protein with cAMP-binding, CBS, and nucleotidyltransferase domain